MVEQIKCTNLPSFSIILVLHFQEKNSLLSDSDLQLPNPSLPGNEENVDYGLQQAV